MKYQYVVAGVQVRSNHLIPGLNPHGEADTITTLCIGMPPSTTSPDYYLYPDDKSPFAAIQRDGQAIWLTRTDAVSVRQVIPFAAALQGKMTIHAAAVCYQDRLYAFIGASGVGKSTLARTLENRGLIVIADDLLACRDMDGKIVALDGAQPLTAIYFLQRNSFLTHLQFSTLTKKQALQNLIIHGFGELHAPSVWASQFVFYRKVIDTLPLFDLIVPDSLNQLPIVVDDLMKHWQATT